MKAQSVLSILQECAPVGHRRWFAQNGFHNLLQIIHLALPVDARDARFSTHLETVEFGVCVVGEGEGSDVDLVPTLSLNDVLAGALVAADDVKRTAVNFHLVANLEIINLVVSAAAAAAAATDALATTLFHPAPPQEHSLRDATVLLLGLNYFDGTILDEEVDLTLGDALGFHRTLQHILLVVGMEEQDASVVFQKGRELRRGTKGQGTVIVGPVHPLTVEAVPPANIVGTGGGTHCVSVVRRVRWTAHGGSHGSLVVDGRGGWRRVHIVSTVGNRGRGRHRGRWPGWRVDHHEAIDKVERLGPRSLLRLRS